MRKARLNDRFEPVGCVGLASLLLIAAGACVLGMALAVMGFTRRR